MSLVLLSLYQQTTARIKIPISLVEDNNMSQISLIIEAFNRNLLRINKIIYINR